MDHIGGIGRGMIFVSALATLAFTGTLWLMYLCHCFLVVLTESSAGIDEVRWPGESVLDFAWKPVYCLLLLVLCGTAGGVIVAPFFVTGPVGFVVFFATFLWFAYPVALLSTLHAQNWFAVVDPALVGRLVRHPRALLLVTLITLPPVAATLALLWGLVARDVLFALPAAVVLPPAVFFYARAWGRLAWLVLNARETSKRERRPLPKGVKLDVADPWAAPPEPEVPEVEVEEVHDEAITARPPPKRPDDDGEWSASFNPYGVMSEETARAEWQKPRPADPHDDDGGYGMGAPLPVPEEPKTLTEHYEEEARKRRARMARVGEEDETVPERKRRRPTFGLAFGGELFLFPFYPQTVRAWLNLAAATLFVLAFLRVVVVFWPV
jgi:hypothetical protein